MKFSNTLYLIKMTSNTTPPPFETNNYLVFDGDKNTRTERYHSGNNVEFTIKIDKNIILSQIGIFFSVSSWNESNYTINSISIYGINDNNEEILINTSSTPMPNVASPLLIPFDNDKQYKKYKIIISISATNCALHFNEIELYRKEYYKFLYFNNNYYGFNDNDFISFDNINSYEKYNFNVNYLNNNLHNLENIYPFKVIKCV